MCKQRKNDMMMEENVKGKEGGRKGQKKEMRNYDNRRKYG